MSDMEQVYGPIDFVLMEFPRDRMTGEAAEALLDLVDQGIVRVYDILVLAKDEDGGIDVLELSDSGMVGGFTTFSGARSGLLDDDDVREAAEAMEPGKAAVLIVYENTWAIPFIAAARRNGGEAIASARIPADAVMEALASLETNA